jgi:hypothetical protein
MNIGQLIIIGIGFISGAITLYLLLTTKHIEHEKQKWCSPCDKVSLFEN